MAEEKKEDNPKPEGEDKKEEPKEAPEKKSKAPVKTKADLTEDEKKAVDDVIKAEPLSDEYIEKFIDKEIEARLNEKSLEEAADKAIKSMLDKKQADEEAKKELEAAIPNLREKLIEKMKNLTPEPKGASTDNQKPTERKSKEDIVKAELENAKTVEEAAEVLKKHNIELMY